MFQDYLERTNGSILFSTYITTDIEQVADYVLFLLDGRICLNIDMDTFKSEFGLLKLTSQELSDLGEFDFLYQRRSRYAHEFLIRNRTFIKREYPDLACDPISIEDTLIMMKRGQAK